MPFLRRFSQKSWVGVCSMLPNPYLTYDQNLQFSLPYLNDLTKYLIPYSINDRCMQLAVALNILWRAFDNGLISNDEKVGSSKEIHLHVSQDQSAKNSLFLTKIDTL